MFSQALQLFQHQKFEEARRLLLSLKARGTRSPEVFHLLGIISAMSGQLSEAIPYFQRAVQLDPTDGTLHFNLAKAFAGLGKDAEALPHHRKAIHLVPANPDAWCNYGLSLLALKKYADAVQALERGFALAPQDLEIRLNLAVALFKDKKPEQALPHCEAVLSKRATASTWVVKANILQSLEKDEESLACVDEALRLQTDYTEAYVSRGIALHRLERHVQALGAFDQALGLNPQHVNALYHRAATLQHMGRLEEALSNFRHVLELDPTHEQALTRLLEHDLQIKDYQSALARSSQLVKLFPDNFNFWIQKGVVLQELKQSVEALDHFDQAHRLDPKSPAPWVNKGNLCTALKLMPEAVDNFNQAYRLAPLEDGIAGWLMESRNKVCDWNGRADLERAIDLNVRQSDYTMDPFSALGFVISADVQLQLARRSVARKRVPEDPWQMPLTSRDRLRVAYFSPDFKTHAVAILTAELFELHDRSRFEVHAVSLDNEEPASPMRQRLMKAFDHFHHVHDKSTPEIVDFARSLELDIAVDLTGFTKGGRPELFVRRVAPVQVNYLGFPGTMGDAHWDYIVADETVVPLELAQCYGEQIMRLPHVFQVNDRQREVSDRVFTRAELGLPETGFVYCCFSNTYKISPERFGAWMRVLQAVPGSCLWLLSGHEAIENNLKREAQQRGVDPARLVFGKHLPPAEYLARFRMADLFLDTHPFNAGTTASDALWAGLPVLTAPGEAFASRMAASLVKAAGLPELVARDQDHYEALAIELGNDPQRMSDLRAKLKAQLPVCDLFNTPQTVRDLEEAFEAAVRRAREASKAQQ